MLLEYSSKYKDQITKIRDLEKQLNDICVSNFKPIEIIIDNEDNKTDEEFIKTIQDQYRLFIYVIHDKIVGIVWIKECQLCIDALSICYLVVDKPHRENGYGKAIVEGICSMYKDVYKYITLTVDTNNPAVDLYKSMGFQELQKTMYISTTR